MLLRSGLPIDKVLRHDPSAVGFSSTLCSWASRRSVLSGQAMYTSVPQTVPDPSRFVQKFRGECALAKHYLYDVAVSITSFKAVKRTFPPPA